MGEVEDGAVVGGTGAIEEGRRGDMREAELGGVDREKDFVVVARS